MADARTEAKQGRDGHSDEDNLDSEALSASNDGARQSDVAAGATTASSEQAGKSGILGSRFGKLGLIAVAVVLAVLVFMFAGAGTLNVGVSSSSGVADDALVDVALYKGDVTAVLSDDDPSNDPEPLEVNRAEVGHRTSFNVKDLGEHTVQATLVDASEGAAKSIPVTVNMFGIDSFAEVVVG